MKKIFVLNSKGEKELFSFQKVINSLKKAGVSKEIAFKIAKEIEKNVYPGIKTSKIFKQIKKSLSKTSPCWAMKFSLKEAMKKLGPTGFPFEKFIREVLINQGFEVKINQYICGKCKVFYEVDFIAKKEKKIYIGECKYHHFQGERVDLKVVLEVFARFLDIKENSFFKRFVLKGGEVYPMIVTNTKFTSNAIRYAKCQKISLLGWKYPKNKGLEYFIEKEKLYPITILPSFKSYLKDVFSQKKLMLVKDLLENDFETLLRNLNIKREILTQLINESKTLLNES